MRYSEIDALPEAVRKDLPEDALDAFLKAANAADLDDELAALRAGCRAVGKDWIFDGHELQKREGPQMRKVAEVSEELGLVFGWAMVCKIDGEDYYDLNIDKNADGTFEIVPEHIPEATMLKSSADFMMNSERPGNEMHKGADTGTFVFAFPATTEVLQKMLKIEQPAMTGLMVAYKAEPDVLAKFKDGTYTGFSIEGGCVASEDLVDA